MAEEEAEEGGDAAGEEEKKGLPIKLILIVVGVLALAGGGYFAYTNFFQEQAVEESSEEGEEKGEGGEGGQGAAKAGNGKQAPLRCQRGAMNEIANKQANKPAAGEVGGEGAVGNGVVAAVEPKAQCPSQVSADDGSGAYGQD